MCTGWNIVWNEIGHDSYMSKGTGVLHAAVHHLYNMEATVQTSTYTGSPPHLSY